MPRFNRAYTIAFSIDTDHDDQDVTAEELLAGLERRLVGLRANPTEVLEACGSAFDSFKYEGDC